MAGSKEHMNVMHVCIFHIFHFFSRPFHWAYEQILLFVCDLIVMNEVEGRKRKKEGSISECHIPVAQRCSPSSSSHLVLL